MPARWRTSDENIGRLLEELESLGLDDRTLVVVTADHGEGMGDHGESRHSLLVYQSTMHVPLVFAGPDVPRGKRIAAPVQSVDIAPTILAWAGLAADPSRRDGISLLPAWAGERGAGAADLRRVGEPAAHARRVAAALSCARAAGS